MARTGRPPTIQTPEWFWTRVNVKDIDQCWPWLLGTYTSGYGQLTWKGKGQRAHRVAYLLTYGMWPDPVGRHTCDNPICCNPHHIIPGTPKQNSQDKIIRGRQPKGVEIKLSKLTDKDVVAILQQRAQGDSLKTIAKRFKVSFGTVGHITQNRTWRHIPRCPEQP